MQEIVKATHEGHDRYISKYHILERSHGFLVEGADRVPVTVERHPRHLAVCYTDPSTGQEAYERFGFYEFYAFSQRIAEVLMLGWKPLPQPDDRCEWGGLRDWALKQTAWALRTRLHGQWQRLLQQVEPTVLAVHRAIFAATMGCSPLALREELYQEPYLPHDIMRYRAAAIAAEFVCCYIHPDFWAEQGLTALHERWDEAWGRRFLDRLSGFTPEEQADLVEAFLVLLRNWLGFFSPNLEPYASLNKTLMQLPGGVPLGLIGNLTGLYLPRPLLERTELIVVTYLAEQRVPTHNRDVFHHARAPQIKDAMRRVAAHTHNDLSPRRTRDLMFVVDFLADYPEVHRGNLVGLAKKSIRWHREAADRRTTARLARLAPQTPTARPPIPLPDAPGVGFLDTVEAICEEGATMRHCVAAYAPGAVHGHHYLFHVAYAGEQATVMVDAGTGKLLQAHGPHNQRNHASVWGAHALQQWGRHWPVDRSP